MKFQDIPHKLVNKEFVIVSELTTLVNLKNKILYRDIEIGENKYYYTLIGYPINKNRTETRVTWLYM